MPRKELQIGQVFGKRTIIKEMGKDKWGTLIYLCKCECGKEDVVRASQLRTQSHKNCVECAYKSRIVYEIEIGHKFGTRTVIGHKTIYRKKYKVMQCKCECVCGRIDFIDKSALTNNRANRCFTCFSKPIAIGTKFGERTVIKKSENKKNGLNFECQCSCGRIDVIPASILRFGNSRRCFDCHIKRLKKL